MRACLLTLVALATASVATHLCTADKPSGRVDCARMPVRLQPRPCDAREFVVFNDSEPLLAPLLHGGVGNVLFQIATMLELAARLGRRVLLGHFSNQNSHLRTFGEWGGHEHPFRGATWCDYVADIVCIAPKDQFKDRPRRFNDDYAYDLSATWDFQELPQKVPDGAFFIQGYFFNYRYWHRPDGRPLVRFRDGVIEYVDFFYGPALAVGNTVSLHLRSGYAGEPAPGLLAHRAKSPPHFWSQALDVVGKKLMRSREELKILVFSDTSELLSVRALRDYFEDYARLDFLFVDEDALISVYLMSRCAGHILESSTLSFWGAYLDARRGPAVVHENIYRDHGPHMLPPEERWIVLK